MDPQESWYEEKQSAWLYRKVAEAEAKPRWQRMFTALADAAERQSEQWERKLALQGSPIPKFQPGARVRLVGVLVGKLGPRRLRPALAAMKIRGLSVYTDHPIDIGHPMPRSVDEVSERHQGFGGSNLRAAVFGVNDGLVSNASLILGVAGASNEVGLILTSGVAGLLAGALSMAAGELVSVRSQREMFEYQIHLEQEELDAYPDEEAEELALIYEARGMDLDEARRTAKAMIKEPQHALSALAREELGLNPDDLGSPWGAAVYSFLAFTAGALIPLLPFLVGMGRAAGVPTTAGITGLALFAVGATLSLFTGRSAWLGGLRMVLIGGSAGLVTFAVGHQLGLAAG